MAAAGMFASLAGVPLPEAATQLASVGAPVFPCVPGGKRPLVAHGFHEATTDAAQVAAWWRRWPSANIGVPTGAASGVEVVDVDLKTGGSGFATFGRARRAGLIPGWLALVRTPSGGMHAYFPVDPARSQSSWQAARARVDFRGQGGYVLVPPSMVEVPEGLPGRYALTGAARAGAAPVDAAALRVFLDPQAEPSPVRRAGVSRVRDAERLAGWVAALGEGERNRGLFWAACRLAEAGASPAAAVDVLGPAAERAGLPPREVVTTIRSAFRTIGTTPAGPTPGTSEHESARRQPSRVGSRVLS